MSGIVGIYDISDRPVERETLGRMVDRLAHRGPDGAEIWYEGNVGLGHRMLWTTPESLLEKQPLVERSGNFILTADARIDNREELISALGLHDRPVEKITDSDLILAAYLKWGDRCPEKLIGDFAFAIWDKHKQVLFCARDHMGVKPFYYYYQPGRFFAFASEIKGLLCLENVPNRVNEAKVGVYLCQLSGFSELKPDTFYEDIFRLQPAHSLEVSQKGLAFQSYWDLNAEAQKIQFKSDAEYVEEFRERFTEAIRCRLRSAYPIASTLSGGLDSSSVSCIARNLLSQHPKQTKLPTIYSDCGVPSTDEKGYVNTILAQGGFQHHIAPVTRHISAAQIVTPWLDRPVQMPTPAMLLSIMQSVRQQEARVLLTGHDGDTIVSHGTDYPQELIDSGEWDTLRKMLWSQFDNGKEAKTAVNGRVEAKLYDYAQPYLKNLTQTFSLKNYIKAFKDLTKISQNRKFIIKKIFYLLARNPYLELQYRRNVRWKSSNPNLNLEFTHQINLSQLLKEEYHYQFAYFPSEYWNHYHAITSSNLLASTEQIDGIAGGLAVEPRHPFLDKRLIELCLAVPAHLKYCKGFGRGVMRRAMKNILSEEVRHRRSKVDFSGFLVAKMEEEERPLIEDLLSNRQAKFSHYIDIEALSREYQDFAQSSTHWRQRRRRARLISTAMFLEIWLNLS